MTASLLALGLSRLQAFGDRLLQIRYRWLVVGLMAIEIARIGSGLSLGFVSAHPGKSLAWPTSSGLDSFPLWLVTTWLPPVPQLLPLLAVALSVGTLGLVAILGHATFSGWRARIFFLGVLGSAIPLRLVEGTGHYDTLFILGSVLIAFPQRWLWVVGSLIATTSHSEASVISGVSVLLVGFAFRQQAIRQRGLLLTLIGTASTIAITTAGQLADRSSDTRATLLVDYLGASIANNVAWLPQTLASGYLAAWLVVIVMIMSVDSGRQVVLLTSGLVLLPALTMVFTLDGTRVFVVSSTAAFLLTFIAWLSSGSTAQSPRAIKERAPGYLAGVLFILMIVVPETSVFTLSPDIRIAPWKVLVDVYFALR